MSRSDGPVDRRSNDIRARILVIDADPGIRRLLHSALSSSGYKCMEVVDLDPGCAPLDEFRPDLVLIGTEDAALLELISQVKHFCQIPVIVLSTRRSQMVPALDAGADDYVEKPFHLPELLARVRVALRHAAQIAPGETSLQIGNIRIDLERRLVTRDHRPVRLSRREYEVLVYLVRHPGQLLPCQQMMQDIWGVQKTGSVTLLREYIRVLRRKLESDPGCPRYILTEPMGGYRLWTGT